MYPLSSTALLPGELPTQQCPNPTSRHKGSGMSSSARLKHVCCLVLCNFCISALLSQAVPASAVLCAEVHVTLLGRYVIALLVDFVLQEAVH